MCCWQLYTIQNQQKIFEVKNIYLSICTISHIFKHIYYISSYQLVLVNHATFKKTMVLIDSFNW